MPRIYVIYLVTKGIADNKWFTESNIQWARQLPLCAAHNRRSIINWALCSNVDFSEPQLDVPKQPPGDTTPFASNLVSNSLTRYKHFCGFYAIQNKLSNYYTCISGSFPTIQYVTSNPLHNVVQQPSRHFPLNLANLPFTIYHQGFFHSVRRNPSLNCFHRRRSLAILGHAVPRWRTRLSLHLVLGLPCRLVHSRGVHSVTLLVHLLSLNRAMCPAHPCIPFLITSIMSFTPV